MLFSSGSTPLARFLQVLWTLHGERKYLYPIKDRY
jgi:hypothetical protein